MNDVLYIPDLRRNLLSVSAITENNGEIESYLVEENKLKLWHRKLGHMGLENLKKLTELSTGMTLNKKEINNLEVCEVCLQAFNTVRKSAKRPLEIIHSDICGPIEPITWDGKSYILTVLDDYTHYSKVYLLKTKDEASEYLKEFIMEAEAYKNVKTHKTWCDNGGEYANTNFK